MGPEETQMSSWTEALSCLICLSIRPSSCRPAFSQNHSRPWLAGPNLFTAGSRSLTFWKLTISSRTSHPRGAQRPRLGVTDTSRKGAV